MWGERPKYGPLACCFSNQADIPLGEVSKPAVNELRGAAARSGCKIALLDETNPKSLKRGLAGDACSGDPAPDNEDVD
jgi:hypothetical protein